jgi:tRNA(Ile)-lysidine synthase
MKRASTKLRPIEFSVFGRAKKIAIQRVAACVSGGRDSIAMIHILNSVQKRLGFSLVVVHVHHGPSKSEAMTKFRDRAARKVEKIALNLELPFVLLRASPKGDSEDALRVARFGSLSKLASEESFDFIALGHHADDLFETRLIRLIRGTGAQGLRAMRPISIESYGGARLWRPLLESSKQEIQIYLESLEMRKSRDWLDDPSNRDARYLRNDIRKRLLPLIESVRPGAVAAMARSLELMAESLERSQDGFDGSELGIRLNRAELLSLNSGQRRSRLASWLRATGVRGISRGQIDEIIKRIDTPRKHLTFKLGGRVWHIDLDIQIERETPPEN